MTCIVKVELYDYHVWVKILFRNIMNTRHFSPYSMEFDPTSLDARKQHAIALLPPPHLLPPQENELFSSWKEAKTRLQDYAFTQGFALVTKTHDKKNHLIVLDCTRRQKRVRNARKVEEEDRMRANTKVSFNECPYRLRLKKIQRQCMKTNSY